MILKGLTLEELREYLFSYNLPSYRADQIYKWLYQKQVCQWEEMTDLPLIFRKFFNDRGISLGCLSLLSEVTANDGTVKYLFELDDQKSIESIFLPELDRRSVCLSTQVGCGMGCIFCATGQVGAVRNLTTAEIIDQLLRITRLKGVRISNVVIMGQGEPLLNYEAVLKAIRIMNDRKGMEIGARHITISTCGIIPGILKLAGESLQINLAVSLHATDDSLRDYLMPINKRYPLRQLLEACRSYINRTGRRITFEYTMIEGINDRPGDLKNLIVALSGLICHVNLIPFNPVPNSNFKRSHPSRTMEFLEALNEAGLETTVRKEKGTALAAACGQLQGKRLEKDLF